MFIVFTLTLFDACLMYIIYGIYEILPHIIYMWTIHSYISNISLLYKGWCFSIYKDWINICMLKKIKRRCRMKLSDKLKYYNFLANETYIWKKIIISTFLSFGTYRLCNLWCNNLIKINLRLYCYYIKFNERRLWIGYI